MKNKKILVLVFHNDDGDFENHLYIVDLLFNEMENIIENGE